ncbi:hypothetical protein [Aureimonas phyllosphaerae]|uniref:Uncharacterized protein n=1 Tax=Aureimonas phyllosphaerae TaxID=1166078 RepID=A0A7W6BUU1_9HYPH|nr:hypothetical protein [Aureimonas phyllosphaerae]MBB3934136.1 hypothetical protein [Aureimonas phyllosphaerae]MBB3958648.1 hypothetical protein [Aureimonas phyllosphaerae]SFF00146.1 hypothetical protein SAMN05216566_101622 [Aureimonas phyllosphaerae]
MGVVGSFLRRLLVQALVSGTVMAGLQIAVRLGPEMFGPSAPTAAIQEPTGINAPAATPTPTPLFVQDRTHADVKAARFPVWQEREARVATILSRQPASRKSEAGPGDVMLFDRCRPDCESRDPLLASNRRPMTTPAPAVAPKVLDDVTVSSAPEAVAFEAAPSEGIVATAARGGLSVARRLVGTAGSVIGW